jgi:hypothetical protein
MVCILPFKFILDSVQKCCSRIWITTRWWMMCHEIIFYVTFSKVYKTLISLAIKPFMAPFMTNNNDYFLSARTCTNSSLVEMALPPKAWFYRALFTRVYVFTLTIGDPLIPSYTLWPNKRFRENYHSRGAASLHLAWHDRATCLNFYL